MTVRRIDTPTQIALTKTRTTETPVLDAYLTIQYQEDTWHLALSAPNSTAGILGQCAAIQEIRHWLIRHRRYINKYLRIAFNRIL